MKCSFHPEAEAEFLAAIDYYEGCRKGLGLEFAAEVRSVVARVAAHPRAWPVLAGEVRRSLANRFPYGVLYAEDDEGICILAVMHLHRDPDYWKERRK